MPDPAAAAVEMVNPATGDIEAVPAQDAAVLARDGDWEIATPEIKAQKEYAANAGYGEALKALAEGAASGLTVGLSDVALAGLGGDEYRASRAQRDAQFGGLHTLGELGGGVGGVLLSGGSSLGARGAVGLAGRGLRAAATPTRLLARAGMATEGLVGRGLARAGLTGETILGRAVSGAARIGAGGAVEGFGAGMGHALSEAALAPGGDYSDLAEKLLVGGKDGALFGLGAGAALGGGVGLLSGAGRAGARRLGMGGEREVRSLASDIAEESAIQALDPSKKGLRELSQGGRKVEDIRKMGRQLIDDDIVGPMRSTEDMLKRADEVAERAGEHIGDVLKRLDDAGVKLDSHNMFMRLDDSIARLSKELSPEHRAVAKQLDQRVRLMMEADANGQLGFEQLHKARRSIDDAVRWGKVDNAALNEELKGYRAIIEDELTANIDKHGARLGEAGLLDSYQAAKRSYRAAAFARGELSQNMLRGQANRTLGLLENIQGAGGMVAGALTGSFGIGAVTSLGMMAGTKFLKDHGRSVLMDVAERVAKSDAAIDKAVRGFFQRAKAGEFAAIGEGARVEARFSPDRALARKDKESRQDAYARVRRDLDGLRREPPGMTALAAHAPRTAAAVQMARDSAVSYLESKAPKAMQRQTSPLMRRMSRESPPSAQEIHKFARILDAAKNPERVLERVQTGTVSRDEIEALKAVYPRRFAQLQQQTMAHLAEYGGDMSYRDRVQLGLLLDIEADPSLRPESIRLSQSAYAQAGAAGGSAPGPAPRSASAPKRAASFESRSTQLETGEMETI